SHASGDADADDDAVGIAGELAQVAFDDLPGEVGDGGVAVELDAVGLGVVVAKVGLEHGVSADNGRGGHDLGETAQGVEHARGVLHAGHESGGAVDLEPV